MGFALDTGYIPVPIQQMMDSVMANVNAQFGTSYTRDTFVGTNFYKFFYALMQRLQENEVKTAEIFLRMQEYFAINNEKIQRPNTTHPGIYDFMTAAGWFVSTKEPLDADAGKAFICVDIDDGRADYAARKIEICKLISQCVVAGVVTQGTEVETIVLSNDQSYDFKFNLPNKIPVKLKLTLTTSENNDFVVGSPDDVKLALFNNIAAKYRLGKDFEPQRYFTVIDAPWAAAILLQYSLDGGSTWLSAIYDANYDDIFTFALTDITVVEA